MLACFFGLFFSLIYVAMPDRVVRERCRIPEGCHRKHSTSSSEKSQIGP